VVKHTINCDWVEVNLKALDPSTFDNCENHTSADLKTEFKREGNGNKFYKNYWKIFHEKKEFGTMFTNSRSPRLMDPNNFQLKITNNKLYELGWLDSLKSIMKNEKLSYKSATRMDIALDGGNYFNVF